MHRSMVIYNMPVSKVHKQKMLTHSFNCNMHQLNQKFIIKKGGRVFNFNSQSKHTV